jgi:hypothetical protein
MATKETPYSVLPGVGPYEVAIGTGLITMVEPHEGFDRAYNRWYEDDHFISGALAMPWMFAGRRFVATKALQALRFPHDSAVLDKLDDGKYFSLYWITKDRHEDHERWSVSTNKRLFRDGRIHGERSHVFTAFQDYHGAAYRDGSVPRDIHTLNYPYGGVVLQVVDIDDPAQRPTMLNWLKDEYAPAVMLGTEVESCLFFSPRPLPDDKMDYAPEVPAVDHRITMIWLTSGDPRENWQDVFIPSQEAINAQGKGRVELVAPFIPTFPGTDRYVDQLR